MTVKTHKDAVDYLGRFLRWAGGDLENIDGHALPGYLEAYDEFVEPVTQEEANVIMEVIKLALIQKGI